MPVSGLVVSLSDEPQTRADALAVIGQEARIAMGVLEVNRLAIVLDTASTEEDCRLWDWLNSLAGVSFVDVVFVGIEQRGAPAAQAHQLPTATDRWRDNCPTSPLPVGERQGEGLRKAASINLSGPTAVVIEDGSQDGR